MNARDSRQRQLEGRFPRRAHLTKDDMHAQYFSDLPKDDVLVALELFERELMIQIGFLRPDDSLTALLGPVMTRNPIRWLFYRGLEGDGVAEVGHQLAIRREQLGWSRLERGDLRTFGDFVRAWCRT